MEYPRPKALDEMVGQPHVKAQLATLIAAYRAGRPLDHVISMGPPGLGKTTVASILAHETGSRTIARIGGSLDEGGLRVIVDNHLRDEVALSPLERRIKALRNASKDNDGKDANGHLIIFVDEIHAVHPKVIEMLYPMMEDGTWMGHTLRPFTLIGATTDPGRLPLPFMDRFGVKLKLDYYSEAELVEIVKHAEPTLSPGAAEAIAWRSRGTPRKALTYLRRVLDYAVAHGKDHPTAEDAKAALDAMGIDDAGLDDLDRRLLVTMLTRFNRPVGIAAIASALGEDARMIETVVEPYLVRVGLVNRERTGRVLTPLGTTVAGYAIERIKAGAATDGSLEL